MEQTYGVKNMQTGLIDAESASIEEANIKAKEWNGSNWNPHVMYNKGESWDFTVVILEDGREVD